MLHSYVTMSVMCNFGGDLSTKNVFIFKFIYEKFYSGAIWLVLTDTEFLVYTLIQNISDNFDHILLFKSIKVSTQNATHLILADIRCANIDSKYKSDKK